MTPVKKDAAATAPAPAYENSLGMKFVTLPGTTTLFSIYLTRLRDYSAFPGGSRHEAGFSQTENDPVVTVSWEDAMSFCGWLTQKEHASKKLPADWKYRLPTDQEWNVGVGMPADATVAETTFPWGTDWPPPHNAGNYNPSLGVDSFAYTSPVGSFPANAFGLYDMGGNAWEWCMDRFNESVDFRVLRGASWHMRSPGDLLSSARIGNQPDIHLNTYGFRCVIERPADAAAK